MSIHCKIEAVIDVIVDQPTPCLADRLLDRIQLLRQFQAASAFIEHRDNAVDMSFRPFQAFDDIRVRLVDMSFYHAFLYPTRGVHTSSVEMRHDCRI